MARYKLRVGHQINSATLIADAQHSWLDTLSFAGALGWEITAKIVVHLMDGVDPSIIAGAERQALSVAGVGGGFR